ncbi:MAG: GNAT family N-acetyltransferase [Actinomycetota bacterium]
MRIELNTSFKSREVSFIKKKLDEYNLGYTDGYNEKPLNVFINEKGEIIGGLVGITYWNWLYIDRLWVDKKHRGKGLGAKILETAEKEARLRGCTGIHLDVHDFQNIAFYKKRGFKIQGEIKDLPEEHSRYLIIKIL